MGPRSAVTPRRPSVLPAGSRCTRWHLKSGPDLDLTLWGPRDRSGVRRPLGPPRRHHIVGIRPEGGRAGLGSVDGTVASGTSTPGREIRCIRSTSAAGSTRVAFLPDGKAVLSAGMTTSSSGTSTTGREIRRFDGHREVPALRRDLSRRVPCPEWRGPRSSTPALGPRRSAASSIITRFPTSGCSAAPSPATAEKPSGRHSTACSASGTFPSNSR